jgi:hypothetical protein
MKLLLSALIALFSLSANALTFQDVEIGDVKLVSFLGNTSLFISNEECSLADKVVSDASLYVFHKEQHKKGCVVLKEDVPYAVFYEQEQYSVFKINMEIFARFVEL